MKILIQLLDRGTGTFLAGFFDLWPGSRILPMNSEAAPGENNPVLDNLDRNQANLEIYETL
jgi:hypothetical protein